MRNKRRGSFWYRMTVWTIYLMLVIVTAIIGVTALLLSVPSVVIYYYNGRNILQELLGKPVLKVRAVLWMLKSLKDDDHE